MVETAEAASPQGPALQVPDSSHARENQAIEFLKRSRQTPTQEKGPEQRTQEEEPSPEQEDERFSAPSEPGQEGPESEDEGGEEESDAVEIDPATKIRVKASGELRDVTFQELKDSYASKAELSKLANLALDDRKALAAQREEYGAVLTKAKTLMVKLAGSPPDESLLDTDPASYLREQKAYEKRIEALGAIDGELAKVKEEGSKEDQEKQRAWAMEQYGLITKAIPDFEKIKGGILEHVVSLGGQEAEIRGAHPHWLYVMAKNSMELTALKAANPSVTKKLRDAPRMTRPGSTNPRDPNREVNQLREQMADPKLSPKQREALTVQMFALQRGQPQQQRRG